METPTAYQLIWLVFFIVMKVRVLVNIAETTCAYYGNNHDNYTSNHFTGIIDWDSAGQRLLMRM